MSFILKIYLAAGIQQKATNEANWTPSLAFYTNPNVNEKQKALQLRLSDRTVHNRFASFASRFVEVRRRTW